MKAIVRDVYGGPEVLRIDNVELPAPNDNEIQVKVKAATINRTDCATLAGVPFVSRFITGFPKPKLKSTGSDFAGIVTAAGAKVKDIKEGDKVFGFEDSGLGSHSEYLCVSVDRAVRKIPEGMSFDQAAASIEGFHYAYNFINKVSIEPGQKVLVNGGTGAIGSAMIQLLKHYKLEITAVCGNAHMDTMRSMGANKVIDYENEDFTSINEKFQYVFDAVGKSRFKLCNPLLHEKGIYISSELGPNSENLLLAMLGMIKRGKKVVFPLPVDIPRSIDLAIDLFKRGSYIPLIDCSYSMEEFREAFSYVCAGKKIGNVILHL